MTDQDPTNELDCATFHSREDTDGTWYVGFNCPSKTGGFLTFLTPDRIEQAYVSREELEWLRDTGISSWLAEMDGASDDQREAPEGGKL